MKLIPAVSQSTRDELRPIIVSAVLRWEAARANIKAAKKPRSPKEDPK